MLIETEIEDGKIRITCETDNAFSPGAYVDYWEVPNARDGEDRWRFEYSHHSASICGRGPFSHPSKGGAAIYAKRFFIDCGLIEIPADNSHLSERTAHIAKSAQSARRHAMSPKVGDWVVDAIGSFRRICTPSYGGERMQLTIYKEHSYYVDSDGTSSYSGGCGRSVPIAELSRAPSHPERIARFWTFRDGSPGAGRGVDLWLYVACWQWSGEFGGTGQWD